MDLLFFFFFSLQLQAMLLVKTAELCIVTVGAVQMSGSGVATRSPTLESFYESPRPDDHC